MNGRLLFALTMIFFTLITGTESFAQDWHIGGGFSFVAPRKELAGISAGPGFTINIGHELTPSLDLDAQANLSRHTSSGVNVFYTILSVGPRLTIDLSPSLSARVSTGLSCHVIDFEDVPIEIDGSGYFLGIGIERKLDDSRFLGFEVQGHTLNGEDNFGNPIDGLSVIVKFFFRSYLFAHSSEAGSKQDAPQ